MVPPTGDGRSPGPIDRPVLAFLQSRLAATPQVEEATITDASGHLELAVVFASAYYPESLNEATVTVRWYTNDDFKIHYREVYADDSWECRWDRHPNPHNTQDHFHPPPTAPTPGANDSWPADHRDVLTHVLDEIEQRITHVWEQSNDLP